MEYTLSSFLRQLYLQTLYKSRSRYRKTWSGFLWVILNPIVMYSVQSFIFHLVLKIEMPHYAIFLLGGLLPWIFINNNFEMGIPTLVSSSSQLKSYPINPLTLVLSTVMDNFINFILTFLLILIPLIAWENQWQLSFTLLPLILILILIFSASLTSLLSMFNVFYRDTKFVVSFLMQIFYFLTPIFYPIDIIPEHIQVLLNLNPFYHFIELFRCVIYQFSSSTFFYHLSFCLFFTVGAYSLTNRYWMKHRNGIYNVL